MFAGTPKLLCTESNDSLNSLGDSNRYLVIIPTFNNDTTIRNVIERVASEGFEILVINDGSTDATLERIAEFQELFEKDTKNFDKSGSVAFKVLSHKKNLGKGSALKTGFSYCMKHSYTHAIVFDADGQHLASELRKICEWSARYPSDLIIGARDFATIPHVPSSSKFGRSFSNMWVWLETGCLLKDTQSGLRCYPVRSLPQVLPKSRHYDFEIEILTTLLWKRVQARECPIQVYYPPPKERVSHFRGVLDNARLSLAHTRLCCRRILALLGLISLCENAERRGSFLISFFLKFLGLRASYFLMYIVTPFYYVLGSKQKKCIESFYSRLSNGEKGRTFRKALRNYYYFSSSLIDRVGASAGLYKPSFKIDNEQNLREEIVAQPGGFFMVGAHLGDWSLCSQAFSRFQFRRIAILIDVAQSPQFQRALRSHGESDIENITIIDTNLGGVEVILAVKKHISSGGIVCFLGDRGNEHARMRPVQFLGKKALFPLAPFELPVRLKCPVFSFYCLKTELQPNAPYELIIKKLEPETHSAIGLQQEFVSQLESVVRKFPWCWFNFFDFWKDTEDEVPMTLTEDTASRRKA